MPINSLLSVGRTTNDRRRVFVVRFTSLSLLIAVASLIVACSLASPAPVGQANPPAQQQPSVQEQPVQPLQLPTRRPNASNGAVIYQQKCLNCHGAGGVGDGTMAAQIQSQFGSPVADLTADAVARAKTPAQWYDAVSNGRLQQGMPPFANSLEPDQRWDVIAYAWTLAAPPDQIARGKQVYDAQCAQCHGATGKGDGKDAKGQLPDFSDFATLAKTAAGRWDEAMSSTHQPSFAGTLSDAEKRAAIDYIRTFAYDYVASAPSPSSTPSSPTAGNPPANNPVGPAAPISITGNIVNGTAGQSIPDNLPMTLYILPHGSQQGSLITKTFQSGVQGHFAISDTQAKPGDLLALGATYKDLNFYSDPVTYQPRVTLPITIYESTPDASKVKIDTLHVVVMPGQDGSLNVNEIYVLSNEGDRIVAGMGQPVMQFGLPAAATNFQVSSGMPQDVLLPKDGRLDYYDVIPVGQNTQQIVFQYTLPRSAPSLDRPIFKDVATVNLLVEGDPDKTTVTSDLLKSQGTQVIQGQTYQQFTAAGLAPGQTLAIKISPPAPPFDWRILLGVGLVVVGIIGILVWRRSQRKQPAVAPARSAEIQREALIDQIAALDDEFAAGQLDEINYKAQRAKLKEKLMKLLSEE